ncbi:unnamed protein product [Auanema sp. JU1783]|nr:unnamed protein product [Auanema sp. JU1783]
MSYQDAMAVVSKFGKPDLFITFTANPNWKEVKENLLPGQQTADRPDLISRVFHHKMNALLTDIEKNNLFGSVAAYVAVVEWQKRGLPHCHILVSLHSKDKIRTAHQAEKFIKAEIPDQDLGPELYEKVTKQIMHRVCFSLVGDSAPCYESINGLKKCSKGYPKQFSENTILNEDSYPCYQRRDDGKFYVHNNFRLDNRYVVPYCPYLLNKFNCHVNVEVCGMIKAVKYLFKYVYKGHDKARLRLENNQDEISSFADGRYICAPEAVHRILGYKIERRSHSVFCLHVHEPNNRLVRFQPGQEREAVDKANEVHSTLEAWFELNLNREKCHYDFDPRSLLYTEIPKHFIFASGKWNARKRYSKPVIGRIHYVSPHQTERFALRMLLLSRKGITSFQEMMTVDGELFSSFSETAKAMGLLFEDDGLKKQLMRQLLIICLLN